MIIAGTKWEQRVDQCTPPRCTVRIIQVLLGTQRVPVEVDPTPAGNIALRDTGALDLIATTLTTAQQFGRQGTLHARHSCAETRRKPHASRI